MKKTVSFFIVSALLIGAFAMAKSPLRAESPAVIEVSQPKQLTANPAFERNPSFLKATDGAWWVFFARGRGDPTAQGYNPDTDYYDLCYVRSTDSGATWSEGCLPSIPGGHGLGAFTPAALQDGIGKIWVFYAADGVGVFYFLSTNNGASWSGPLAVPNVAGYTVRSHVDALVAQDGKIWLFYEAGPDNAIYGRSFNGVNWSGLVWVSASLTNAERPRALQEAGTGTFRVVYCAGGSRDIYLATSTTNGASWTSSVIANSGHGDYDPVLVKDGSTWRLFFVPYLSPPTDQAWVATTSSADLTTWTTPLHVTSGHYGGTRWWDHWPEAASVPGKLLLFYGSMKDGSQRGDGDIFMFDVNWNLSREHYEAIQPAIEAASNGDTINVAAGTYKENVWINKQVTLNGPNAGINPNTSSRVAEAVIVPEVNNTASGVVVTVAEHYVTMDGFAVDGNNPDLSGGVSLNAVDANAYYGIANAGVPSNVIVRNNIIQNLIRGVSLNASHAGSSGNRIVNNKFDNMPSTSPPGHGIALEDSFYAEVSGNVMTRAHIGVHTNDFRTTGSPALISNNRIQSSRLGIWHNLHQGAPSPFTIQNNELTTVSGATGNVGLWLTSIRDSADVFVINNNVSGAHTGIQGWNLLISNGITITGGTLDGNSYGVWLYNTSSYPESAGAGGASQLTVNGVTIQNSANVGVRVQDSPGQTSALTLIVQDGSRVSGSPTGALVEGPWASLIVRNSTLNGNSKAVDVLDGAATITNSFLTGNGDGVLVRGGGTATVNFNNLAGNSGLAVNSTMGVLIDASANWWGTNAQASIQAKVGTSVDYTPWLDIGTDTQPGSAGFQGDFSVLNVDDNSPQSPGPGRIQEGVNLVSGSLVKVLPGIYNETVTFGSGFNKNNVTVLGDAASRPVINGLVDLQMSSSITGLTLQNLYLTQGMRLAMSGSLNNLILRNLYIKGDGGGNRVVNCVNAGANNNLTIDTCVIDGENWAGRHGFAGNNLAQNLTIINSEFKNILGWGVMDVDIDSGDPSGENADLPLETVTFANNRVHHCNGMVLLRGHGTAKTRQVNVYGNTFEYIGNNGGTSGDQWAALMIDNALNVHVYNNKMQCVRQGSGGRGDAMQFRRNTVVNVHDNTVINNYAGIYFPGGGYAKDLSGVEIHSNVICGNTQFALRVEPDNIGLADAEGNWWGTNSSPGARVQGSADADPWITWSINANPTSALPNGSSTISVAYSCPGGYTVPNGHVVNWATSIGTLNPISSTTSSGVATTVLTGDGTLGLATITANDLCSASLQVMVDFSGPTATPTHTPTSTPGGPSPSPTPTNTPGGPSPSPTPTNTPGGPSPSPTPTTTSVPETTITIQRGTLGNIEDTQIYQWNATTNYCGLSTFRVGYGHQYQGLLRFDLSPIPAGATIVRAQLQIYSIGWDGSGANINVGAYAILRTTDLCEATWNQAQNGIPWGAPGCNDTTTDRRANPETTVNVNGLNRWYTLDLTALVQSWFDGSLANNGVLLRVISGSGYYAFASSDGNIASNRPKLVVTYRMGGGPAPSPTATNTPAGAPTATPTRTPTSTPTPTPAGVATPTPTGSITVIIRRGTLGNSEDTYIYQWGADVNYCTSSIFKVGYGQQHQGLLRFEFPGSLTGAVVSEAKLQVYPIGWSGSGANITVGAYAILRSTNLCEATWNQARTGVPWGLPGCNDTTADRRANPESTQIINGLNRWYTFDLTDLVQAWLDGSQSNAGVLLRATSGPGYYAFASADGSDVDRRPKLIITLYP